MLVRMNAADTKKALLTAQRAYARAQRATTCGMAANNLRLGQKWEARGHAAMRALIGKTEYRHFSPVLRDLFALDGLLPNTAGNAHEHRLKLCGLTAMQYEYEAAADRARSEGAVDRARDRYERKRPKARRR